VLGDAFPRSYASPECMHPSLLRRILTLAAILSAAGFARAQEGFTNTQAPPAPRVFAETETVAVVGNQHILAGDLLGEINQRLLPYVGKVPDEQLNEQRQIMMRQLLPVVVENKILYQEFLRKVPPDKLAEVKKNLFEEFDKEKLEPAMTQAKVNSPAEMDQLLRKYGSSLEKQRMAYMENKLGRAMIGREINQKPEITHDEMLAYYHSHAADFDVPAKAKYEQLMVRFSSHVTADDASGKREAWVKLAAMGNEVLRGAQFDAVAKKHSEAPNAEQGGKSDWVGKGSLASAPIDEAVFSLPVGLLSQIIEDDRGFHILRVTERVDAHRVEFIAAQAEIKEKLKKQKVQKQIEEAVVKLKAKTTVWTIYDNEVAALPRERR